MATEAQKQAALALAKAEIAYDISIGIVPPDAASLTDVHAHVDANEYGGFTEDASPFSIEETEEIQEAIDAWLQAGRLA